MESNLARQAEAALARFGDYPSLCYADTWHGSVELFERASRAAGGFAAAGVRPGDRVVVIMANCPEVGIVYHALWRAGAVITPIVFLVTPTELAHVLRDSGAVGVVTSAEIAPKVDAAQQAAGTSVPVWVVEWTYGELEAAAPIGIVDRAPDDLAALLYTGGTTGRSKGVALSHANVNAAGAASRSVSHIEGLTRGLSALPMSHSFGLLVTVGLMHTPEPAVSIIQRWFEPKEYLRLAATYGAQTTAVVPSMLTILLGQPLESYDLSSLRFAFSGAAPLPAAVREQFQARVPSCTVLEGYGCTETSAIATSTPPAEPRPGTVGKPVPGVTLRIVGPDGADVAPGQDGEILVGGPNVMRSYWGGEPAGGWFATGDVGRIDAEGYLTIVDRIKDLIIRGGFNVYPRDVEDVLMSHPGVAMAAVIGRPDERLGEEVVGFVSPAEGSTVTEADLIAYARERLSANKYPREIHIVDAIPLTSVGKLDRKRLRTAIAR